MDELLGGLKRTHMCGQLRLSDVDTSAVVMGWVQRRRDLGGVIFIDLRDRTGIVQVVFNEIFDADAFDKAQALRNEYVIAVVGDVVRRSEDTVNPKINTGEIEIRARQLKVLGRSETPPFPVEDDINVSEILRLKYRYLDLRRPDMQRNLMLRHKVSKITRDFLSDEGFIEVETPMLTKSTPEGARDYLVPSRLHPGSFYALPQSPQLFKQLLMISGFDKYFQIARCFRDEDLRADRQPEFTQIDLEMSFVDVEDVIALNEQLIARIFKDAIGMDISLPLKRLTYKEAMERYGSDKPDTRFGLELKDISDIVRSSQFKVFADAVAHGGSVRGINVIDGADKFARRELDALVDFVKTFGAKGLAWITITADELKSPITKFLSQDEIDGILGRMDAKAGDLLLFVADKDEVVFDSLGQLRLELGKRLNLIDDSRYDLLWVTEFPLLEYSEEEKRYVAKHHPFTSPMDEDISLLNSEPWKARAKAYDMVLNGNEIGGGSIRIHSTELQQKMFEVLGFSKEDAWERFGFLLKAFEYGAPPHGGMAYGLDRLVMLLAGLDTIRDVIAFPKVQNASCPLTEAPTPVDEKQLRELHIRVRQQQ
ncbi:aspartate--tRNA ligase [Mahella australiensis]|uniref:Aspartate--tRNA ligase n=1 Tax=Mahella australiensis (strain DSM 15567 / CIP 107919 / 50-1 BON) TaxID=697281 RepID=F4A285_MAHA5|nr:aspartate--tRNA ligase [Mahella australiensis]AEE96132.1 aspartyl-tRNA synthetase [Mahella australiensis 50-1 BON]